MAAERASGNQVKLPRQRVSVVQRNVAAACLLVLGVPLTVTPLFLEKVATVD